MISNETLASLVTAMDEEENGETREAPKDTQTVEDFETEIMLLKSQLKESEKSS